MILFLLKNKLLSIFIFFKIIFHDAYAGNYTIISLLRYDEINEFIIILNRYNLIYFLYFYNCLCKYEMIKVI